MKLCRSCKKEIDDKASKCPYCQTEQGNWAKRHPIITGLLVLFVLGGIGSAMSPKPSTPKNTDNSLAKVVETSPTASTEPTAEPTSKPDKTFSVGMTLEMTDYQLTVNSVKKATSLSYSTPKKGNEFVLVNLTIKNTGEKEVTYNPFDFKIQDSNGNQTTEAFASIDDQLNSGSLASGGKVTGTIVFEAPKGDKQLQLIYQPNVWLDNHRISVQLQ